MATPSEKTEKNSQASASKENEVKPQPADDPGDEDLNDLLDSALEDFDKVSEVSHGSTDVDAASKAASSASQQGIRHTASGEPPPIPPMQEAFFENIFNNPDNILNNPEMSEEMLGNMGEAFAGFMADFGRLAQNPEFKNEMDKILQETMGATGGSGASAMPTSNQQSTPSTDPADFAKTLGDTITKLAENTKEAKDGQIPQEELFKAFENLNMEGGDEMLLPMVQNMMENLLSKDVLYPSLKEVTEKYPQWLGENKDSLPEADYQRYCKQQDLMLRICERYESEKETDTDDVKQQRVTQIMTLIQEMESYGEPPKDIVGDMQSPGLPFDPSAMPNIPGLPQGDQCKVM